MNLLNMYVEYIDSELYPISRIPSLIRVTNMRNLLTPNIIWKIECYRVVWSLQSRICHRGWYMHEHFALAWKRECSILDTCLASKIAQFKYSGGKQCLPIAQSSFLTTHHPYKPLCRIDIQSKAKLVHDRQPLTAIRLRFST